MNVACISDIHVTSTSREAYKVLLSFLKHEDVQDCGAVVLLGDIFDHLTGEHEGYLEKYSEFFECVAQLLDRGTKVYFIEGNHDFHFKNTFKKGVSKLLNDSSNAQNFIYESGHVEMRIGDLNYLFCHGDDLDMNNKAYRRWKSIYSSKFFGWFISNVLTFSIVESIGEKASADSKERGRAAFNYQREKAKYRLAAQEFLSNRGIDRLIAGHTHIADDYEWNEKGYHNIGYPPKDKSFLKLSKNGVERVSI